MGGEQRSSGPQPFTLMSVLLVLVVVGGITGVNVVRSPPRESPSPAPEWDWFNDYGFSFVHIKGTNFTSEGIRDENATRYSGYLFTDTEVEEQPPEEITVVWDLAPLDIDVEDYFEGAIDALQLENETISWGLYNVSMKDYHDLVYQYYNVSGQDGLELSGVVGLFYCNESRRLFTVNLLNQTGSSSQDAVKERFRDFMDYFGCHFSRRRRGGTRLFLFDVYDLSSVSLMVFLCIGFTFTYMMDGFLNFAHTSYAGIGGMVSSYLIRFWGYDSYDTWPVAALVGGLVGMFLYVVLVRPIGTRASSWNRDITLTFTFWVVAIMLGSTSVLYSFWDHVEMRSYEGGYAPSSSFSWYGIPSSVFLGTVYCIILVVGLHLFFRRTRLGLGLRATAMDEGLAATLGVNTQRAHLVSWLISGALAAIAGTIFSFSPGGGGSDRLIISVMTGSILGGLNSIYGAIFGGIFVAVGQKLLNYVLYHFLGIAANEWVGLLPIAFLWTVLIIAPNGITGRSGNPFRFIHGLGAQLKGFKINVVNLLKSASKDPQ